MVPRFLCQICRHATPMSCYVAKVLTFYLHCTQGVRDAPYRVECPVFEREPGADNEWPRSKRGELPTLYPMIEAT